MTKLPLYLKRAAPAILSVIASAGVVATAVLAAKATPKAMSLLDDAEKEKGRKLTKPEIIKTAAPAYIPTVLTGASAIACIIGANALNERRQAALASAYALVSDSFSKYRSKVKDICGEEAHEKVMESLLVEDCKDVHLEAPTIGSNASLDFCDDSKTEHIFHDAFSDRYFKTTIPKVLEAEYHLNRNFTLRGAVSLNEFYEFLGLSPTDFGDAVGWSMMGGIEWIDFDHHKAKLKDGTPCYVIETIFPPETGYED